MGVTKKSPWFQGLFRNSNNWLNHLLDSYIRLFNNHIVLVATAEVLVKLKFTLDGDDVADNRDGIRSNNQIIVSSHMTPGTILNMNPVLVHNTGGNLHNFGVNNNRLVLQLVLLLEDQGNSEYI